MAFHGVVVLNGRYSSLSVRDLSLFPRVLIEAIVAQQTSCLRTCLRLASSLAADWCHGTGMVKKECFA